MSLSTPETQADILVAGAGAAGLSTALALAQAGFSVFCVGHVDTSANGRTVALFEASLPFLQGARRMAAFSRQDRATCKDYHGRRHRSAVSGALRFLRRERDRPCLETGWRSIGPSELLNKRWREFIHGICAAVSFVTPISALAERLYLEKAIAIRAAA